MVGDFNYNPRRSSAETEMDREVRLLVEEMRLQDVSYNGAAGPLTLPGTGGKHTVTDRRSVCKPSVGPPNDGGVYRWA